MYCKCRINMTGHNLTVYNESAVTQEIYPILTVFTYSSRQEYLKRNSARSFFLIHAAWICSDKLFCGASYILRCRTKCKLQIRHCLKSLDNSSSKMIKRSCESLVKGFAVKRYTKEAQSVWTFDRFNCHGAVTKYFYYILYINVSWVGRTVEKRYRRIFHYKKAYIVFW